MREKQMLLDELMARVTELEAENQRLKTENAELRRRLEMNSANSHKPPSSDGYRKKTTQPGLPKGEKKSPGGKVGHTGKTLRQVEKPDKVELHLPKACNVCGRAISAEEKHETLGQRQVFELPEAKLEVIEHRLGQIKCCGQRQCGTYPEVVTASVQYGPGVRAFVTKLSVEHKMPLEQISRLFTDLYHYELNSETIEKALEHGYELAAGLAASVVEQLKQAAVVHFDETGLRVAGKLHWLHTAGNAFYTHLFVHAKRGGKALQSEASVLKDFVGRAIHDCWASYFEFSGVQHGLCNAHLLRELQALAEAKSFWAEAMRIFLLALYRQPLPLPDTAAHEARQRYKQILSQADQEEPPPELKEGKGRPKHTPGRNLLRRLLKHQEAVLAFAFVEGVPFTNNLAERDLRPAKIKQKVSGSFRTFQGAQVYARLQALIATCRKQDRNIFDTLRNLFALRPVSLIPG